MGPGSLYSKGGKQEEGSRLMGPRLHSLSGWYCKYHKYHVIWDEKFDQRLQQTLLGPGFSHLAKGNHCRCRQWMVPGSPSVWRVILSPLVNGWAVRHVTATAGYRTEAQRPGQPDTFSKHERWAQKTLPCQPDAFSKHQRWAKQHCLASRIHLANIRGGHSNTDWPARFI